MPTMKRYKRDRTIEYEVEDEFYDDWSIGCDCGCEEGLIGLYDPIRYMLYLREAHEFCRVKVMVVVV